MTRALPSESRLMEGSSSGKHPGLTYTLTFCGDTSLGDHYLEKMRNGASVYQRLCRDPYSFFKNVRPIVEDSDSLIINFESCLVLGRTSPFEGQKRFIGWDDPLRTIAALKEINVSAVNLANNHTMDFGAEGLGETISQLKTSGIGVFGAGENRKVASEPFMIRIAKAGALKNVYVLGAYENNRKYRDQYKFYAGVTAPGVNKLSRRRIVERIHRLRTAEPGSLIIVCPHWNRNYRWAPEGTLDLCSTWLSAGADLVVGHGAHMLQQCHCSPSGTIILSLGNFVFNSPGRYDSFSAPPFSLIARAVVRPAGDAWLSELKLYPIITDNRRTGFCVQPVDKATLSTVYLLLAKHAIDASVFNSCFEPTEDERGFHIRLKRPMSPRFACAI